MSGRSRPSQSAARFKALEPLGRPFPALFCACLAAEALRSVVEAAAARCSMPWREDSTVQQAQPISLAELASGVPAVGTPVESTDTLASSTCLFRAAALAQRCVSSSSRQHGLTHQVRPGGPFVQHHQQQQHPAQQQIQQALLAGQASSPFALFAAQPSKQGWLTLLHALREQHEEEDDTALGRLPHSILTPRRPSFPARQQAVVHRATLYAGH